jgi:hypothetical protein
MDIDEMIKKYEYKAKVEKIAGGSLFKSKDYLEDLYKLKDSMEPIKPEVKKQGVFRVIWNKFKTKKDKI